MRETGCSAQAVSNTRNSVCLPRHSTQPSKISQCDRNDGPVNAPERPCTTTSKQGIKDHMRGPPCPTAMFAKACRRLQGTPLFYEPQNLRKFRQFIKAVVSCTSVVLSLPIAGPVFHFESENPFAIHRSKPLFFIFSTSDRNNACDTRNSSCVLAT